MKVLLVLVDGMRPDSLVDIPQVEDMKKKAAYTLQAETVFPSVTLPCHVSLFHSVPPQRHGTLTNIYATQVRPVKSMLDLLAEQGKDCAMFYSWAQLRDVGLPGSLVRSSYWGGWKFGYEEATNRLVKEAIPCLKEEKPDFTFLYLGKPDDAGHKYGWMSEEYLQAVRDSWKHIENVLASLDEDYTVFITADHGGHDRIHGMDMPEDMTIPFFAMGKDFAPGKVLKDVSILDYAPTIAKLLGVGPNEEWEGKCLF